jgi:hypothetical protein
MAADLPLAFEENRGQVAGPAAFLARGDGYSVFVAPDETVVKVKSRRRKPGASPFQKPGPPVERFTEHTSVLRMALVGARTDAPVAGEATLPGKVHYFQGGRSTSAPTFRRAKASGIYPGVDVVYYGNRRELEYDFVVAPGADPGQIRFRLEGAKEVALNEEGGLDISLDAGELELRKPEVYQEVAGERRMVASNYRLDANHELGFELGEYDPSLPLVIDPVVVYSTLLGGAGFDSGSAVAMDDAGNVYVTGYTDSTDFPTVGGGTAPRGGDAFVTKLSPDGSQVLFSVYLGGSGADAGRGIGVDSAGRVVVSGTTDSPDFPVVGAFQPTLAGGTDAFVARLSSDGATLEYGTYLGGSGSDGASRLALDPDGNVYLTGYTNSTDFPVSLNAMQPAFSGDYDAFVTKLAAAGGLVFSTYLGGRDGDSGSGIAVDAARNVYVGGSTDSGDFPIGPVSFTDTFQGGRYGDAFVTKLTPDGSSRLYSTYVGGSGSDLGADIAVDLDGYCYITGTTNSNDLMLASPDIQPYQEAPPGGESDIFVHKILPDGTFIVYTTYLGSAGEDIARAIEVDEDRNPHTKAYILGETDSASFPLEDALQSNHGGNSDLFLTKLHENVFLVQPQVVLDYSTYLGGAGLDHAGDLAVDAVGNAAITGDTTSKDFPVHQGPAGAKKKKNKKKNKKLAASVQGFVMKVFDGVAEPGGIFQAPRRVSFGRVRTGRSKTKKLVIRNTSRSSRLAVSVQTPQPPLTLGKGIQSAFLEPGGQFPVNLTFTPTDSGKFNGALVVRSSDPARPVISIPVVGAGKSVNVPRDPGPEPEP